MSAEVMAMAVRNAGEILDAIQETPANIRLFCFFVFDDRPSHQPVLDRLEQSLKWIDSLSANSGIRTFVFAPTSKAGKRPYWMSMEGPITGEESCFASAIEGNMRDLYSNPALLLAKHFGVLPKDLPGILVFENMPDETTTKPCFIPVALARFVDDFEESIAETYSNIQSALECDLQDPIAAIKLALGPLARELDSKQGQLADIVRDTRKGAVWRDRATMMAHDPDAKPEEIRVFISYAREDGKWGKFLYDRLRDAELKPWIDTEDIYGGELWDTAIRRAIDNSHFICLCLSSNSVMKRGWVQREMKLALQLWEEKLSDDIFIIPIRFDECQIPAELGRFQWIDILPPFDGRGWFKVLGAIKEGMRRRNENH